MEEEKKADGRDLARSITSDMRQIIMEDYHDTAHKWQPYDEKMLKDLSNRIIKDIAEQMIISADPLLSKSKGILLPIKDMPMMKLLTNLQFLGEGITLNKVLGMKNFLLRDQYDNIYEEKVIKEEE